MGVQFNSSNVKVVDVLCGGKSHEHDISIKSAVSIINCLIEVREIKDIYIVYINKNGFWNRSVTPVKEKCNEEFIKNLDQSRCSVSPSLNPRHSVYFTEREPIELPDIFFPVLHGTFGEDGTIQGLFEMMQIPYVGCGVLSGSCGMDKDVMRRLFDSENIPLLPWQGVTVTEWQTSQTNIENLIENSLGFPVFVKPANLGSSIGISKVLRKIELKNAMNLAFTFDTKVVVEKSANVREIECAVLGNEKIKISSFGEIIPGSDFYDFEDKYLSKNSKIEIPALLDSSDIEKLSEYTKKAYKVINCSGLSRVDFFKCKDSGDLFINEVNTFPGFTEISMYPKLMEYSGVPYNELLSNLISLGMEKFTNNTKQKT